MNFPHVLILIVTWNKKKDVLRLLDSVMNQVYPASCFQVAVIDNASQDGTAQAIAKNYPDVHLIRNSGNLGGSGGFNTGLQWAFSQPDGKYTYLWLLDNDVIVHPMALSELVQVLEEKKEFAAAGSTMMQTGVPWKVHEMGAFFDFRYGRLILSRHQESVRAWKGKSLVSLLHENPDLCRLLPDCPRLCPVEYVAAASLLIRADIAKSAGLWRDYFIHFDDVEWCLRIGRMGYGIAACARSLIWHSSSSAKVPAQVLYYDKRNMLDLLRAHNADESAIPRVILRTRIKALYFAMTGRPQLSFLYREAIKDFRAQRMGKKENIPPHRNEISVWKEILAGLKEGVRDYAIRN